MAGAATIGGFALLRAVGAALHHGASALALAPPLQLPANLGTYVPLMSSLRDAALSALFSGALLAFVIHLWTRRARRPLYRAALAGKTRVAAGIAGFPLSFQMATLFQAVQRRIQRALLDDDDIARDLLQALRDGIAMQRPERERLEDRGDRACPGEGRVWRVPYALTFYIYVEDV